jgi:hypothetical protein
VRREAFGRENKDHAEMIAVLKQTICRAGTRE